MSAIYELRIMRDRIKVERARYKKELERFAETETFFRRYPYSIAMLTAKIEMLDEMDSWLKTELKKAILIAETEL